jgi:hypothetical protein
MEATASPSEPDCPWIRRRAGTPRRIPRPGLYSLRPSFAPRTCGRGKARTQPTLRPSRGRPRSGLSLSSHRCRRGGIVLAAERAHDKEDKRDHESLRGGRDRRPPPPQVYRDRGHGPERGVRADLARPPLRPSVLASEQQPRPIFLPLFTHLRRRGILRSSHNWPSTKFVLTIGPVSFGISALISGLQ